jgi:hypothetical protein
MVTKSYSRNNIPVGYYVYSYIEENGMPYYIGMGQRKRAWESHRRNNLQLLPADKSKIFIIAHRLTKDEANILETRLISQYGRRSNGTGVLFNITSGGTNSHEFKLTEEQCKRKQEIALSNWQNAEYREKTIKGIKAGTNTNEAKENYSDAHKKQWTEKRDKIIASQKEGNARQEVKERKSNVSAARWKDERFIKLMTVQCEHCGIILRSRGAYSRWHGSNCKNRGMNSNE